MTPEQTSALLRALAPLDALTTGAGSCGITIRVQSSPAVAEPGYLAQLSDSGALAAARRVSMVVDRCSPRAQRALRWLAARATGEGVDPAALAWRYALDHGPGDLRTRLDRVSAELPGARGRLSSLRARAARARRAPPSTPEEAVKLTASMVEAVDRVEALTAEERAVTKALATWGEVELEVARVGYWLQLGRVLRASEEAA